MVLGEGSYPYEFREILVETGLSMHTDLSGVDLPHLVAIGLILRGNRMLRAVEVLVEEEMPDVVDVVLRPVLENAVTALWLLDEPDERLAVILGDHRRWVHRMATWWPSRENRLVAKSFDAFMTSKIGHCESDSMPRLEVRAASLWDDLKPTVKFLSAALHGNVSSGWKSFHQLIDGVIVRESFADEEPPEQAIAYAAYLLLSLAKRINDDLGWDEGEDIDELLWMVEGWKPDRNDWK